MGFTDYAGTPFDVYVLPIIPRGVRLTPGSMLTEDRLGKIPGRRYRDGWGGFTREHPWQNVYQHRESGSDRLRRNLAAYASWYAADKKVETVGMLSRCLPVLDIDSEIKRYADVANDVADEKLGPAPCRTRGNSAKCLRLYRLDESRGRITKRRRVYRTIFGSEVAIEVLGDGQQFLAKGMHPSGVLYEWSMGLSPLRWGYENLTLITPDMVDTYYAALDERMLALGCTVVKGAGAAAAARLGVYDSAPRREIGPDHPDVCPDLDMLRDVLEHYLPVTSPELSTYDEWATACVAIVTACGRDESFYDAFQTWCAANPENDDQMIRGKWESVRESSIGWSYICALAHDHGYIDDVLEAFPPVEAPEDGADGASAPQGPRVPMDGSYEGVIADQFAARHAGTDWIYVAGKRGGEWRRFADGLWRLDSTVLDAIARACREVGTKIRANPQATSQKIRKAEYLFSARAAEAVMRLVKANPAAVVGNDELDDRPVTMGYPDGYVNEEGELCSPDPRLLLTKRAGVRPDFSQDCPKFKALIRHLCNDDQEIVDFFWDLLGYTMTGLCSEQIFVFLLGKQGGEGKTTFTTIMQRVLGDYAAPIRNSMFVRGKSDDANRFATSALKGKRFVYSNELELGQRWAAERVKEITGGGDILVERKYGGVERLRVQATIWFMGNNLPFFPAADTAIQRRMVLLEAKTPIPADKDARGFADEVFAEEGPAILAHLIRVERRYLERGKLVIPEKVRAQVEEQFVEDDTILQFVEERCELDDRDTPESDRRTVSYHALYSAYREWAIHTAELQNAVGRNTFFRLICDHPRLRKTARISRVKNVDTANPSSPRGFAGICLRNVVTSLAWTQGGLGGKSA